MEKVETLRCQLYEAIERGDKEEILTLSRNLDQYIVQITKELLVEKEKHFKECV